MDMEPENFRGGEAIGGHTAGPSNTEIDGSPIAAGFANPKDGLVNLLAGIIRFVLIAAVAITAATFIYGAAKERSFAAGFKGIKALIPK
jgi:hypothetical protein